MSYGKPWLEYWSRDVKIDGKHRTRTMFKVEEGYIISPDTSMDDENLLAYIETGKPKHYDNFSSEKWTKHCTWDKENQRYDVEVWDDETRRWEQVPFST